MFIRYGLWIETGAQVGRDDRAEIVLPAEDAIADARDNIIDRIAQGTWDHTEEGGEKSPAAAEATQNVKEGVRADQQLAATREDYDAIGKGGAFFGRNAGLERGALQRGEAEGGAGAVVF